MTELTCHFPLLRNTPWSNEDRMGSRISDPDGRRPRPTRRRRVISVPYRTADCASGARRSDRRGGAHHGRRAQRRLAGAGRGGEQARRGYLDRRGLCPQSAPDGYTLLVNPDSIAVNPSLYPNLAYDPLKSFEPVSLLMTATQVLVVRPDLGVTDLKSFIELAKSKDAGLNIASAGAGTISHLTGVLLEQRSGFKTTHVPFRGAAPALSAMLGGHVDGMWVMLGARGAASALRQAQGRRRDRPRSAIPSCRRCRPPPSSASAIFRSRTGKACSRRPARRSRSSTRSRAPVVEVLKKPEIAGRTALARLRAARRQRRGGAAS